MAETMLQKMQAKFEYHNDRARAYELVIADLNAHLHEVAAINGSAVLMRSINKERAKTQLVHGANGNGHNGNGHQVNGNGHAPVISIKTGKARLHGGGMSPIMVQEMEAAGAPLSYDELWAKIEARKGEFVTLAKNPRATMQSLLRYYRKQGFVKQMKNGTVKLLHTPPATRISNPLESADETSSAPVQDSPAPRRRAGAHERRDKIKAQRTRSAEMLAHFSTDIPGRNIFGTKAAILIGRKYLKKKGDGYVRTAKEFTV